MELLKKLLRDEIERKAMKTGFGVIPTVSFISPIPNEVARISTEINAQVLEKSLLPISETSSVQMENGLNQLGNPSCRNGQQGIPKSEVSRDEIGNESIYKISPEISPEIFVSKTRTQTREDKHKNGRANQDQRQNANPDNPEFTAVNDVWEEGTQELNQPTAVCSAYANNTQERIATAVCSAYANNTQERIATAVHTDLMESTQELIQQTGNFSLVGQKEKEIFHKQINLQQDQNCAGGGAASGTADKLPTEKNNQKNEKKNELEKRPKIVEPMFVKKKWRATGRLDERFLRYVANQMSRDLSMHQLNAAEGFILKHERTLEGIEMLERYWERMEEGIGIEEWKSPDGEIFPWFLSLVIESCYNARQGNTIEAATMEATKQLRNRTTAAALWKKFKHRVKGEGEKIERNKALGVTGYVPPSWMREEEVELAEVADAVKQIGESSSLPAPRLKQSANKGLETAATSVMSAQSIDEPDKENKQVVGDFKGSNGNGTGEVNGSCERGARLVTGLSGLGEMARAVTVNVAVVEAPAVAAGVAAGVASVEVRETANDEEVRERAGIPTSDGVSQEQIEGIKRISEMVKALKMKKSVKKVNAEIVSEAQPVRELTYFERMNEWIKGKDIALVNEAMKWAMGQEDIEFEHDEEGRVIGIIQKRNERVVAQVG